MDRRRSSPHRRGLVALLVLALGLSVAACSSSPPGPDAAASRFLDAVAAGDDAAAGAATDDPATATAALTATRESLAATGYRAELGKVRASGDTGTADVTVHWTLARGRDWSYPGQLQLARRGSDWAVRWAPSDLHPRLGANQTLALRVDTPPRAAVLDSGGTEVLAPTEVERVVLTPGPGVDTRAAATTLGSLLGPVIPGVTAAGVTAGLAAAGGSPYEVAVVRSTDLGALADRLDAVPGVSTALESRLLPTDPTFAPALLTEVGRTVDDQLDGRAGWRVVTVLPTGAEVDVLTETPPAPAAAVDLSLDRSVQLAAQQAVGRPALPSAMVVLRPSSGEVLAVAQNAPADALGPIALQGLYPPGSTFKVITAAATLQAGLATPQTQTGCPGTASIGERQIGNYNTFDLGTVPLRTAFAASCNTTFARYAAELPADGLTRAAAQLGIGPDYTVPGMTTVTGSVPPAADQVLRAEDGFGQGEVLVTPFGQALAAATVAGGSRPTPTLVERTGTTSPQLADPVDPATVDGLRLMMRQVVTSGSASTISDEGEVYGKTGEAQYGDGTTSHAWFIGWRGDVAFATLIVGGGGSFNAVAVTQDFLKALPPGV
ncbi:penicillin-binding transpeptidase domain-containing protein [Rhodococcus aerolatus]